MSCTVTHPFLLQNKDNNYIGILKCFNIITITIIKYQTGFSITNILHNNCSEKHQRRVPRPLTVYTVTQQRADCQVDSCPLGLLANNIFPNLVGSKSCTVHANLHNDGLINEALSRAARRAQCLEQREAYE